MGNFSHLPTDIMLDIITRLPAESILDCKLVCRPWRNLVSHHPFFYQMYVTHLNNSTDSGKLSFLVKSLNRKLYYFEYYENNNPETPPIESIRRINFTPPFMNKCYYDVIGSINGLVCFYGWQASYYCVCNPVTRECVMIPSIGRDCGYDQYTQFSIGFGYDSVNDEYKVVQLYQLRGQTDCMEVGVYTLGSGKGWRHVGRFDTKFVCISGAHGVFVSGALYWMDTRKGRVLAFNLAEEKIGEYLSPSLLSQDSMYSFLGLGELGGVLYCVVRQIRRFTGFDIWLFKEKNNIGEMKEQVEHESLGWKKEFSLLRGKPLALTKSGGVLCFNGSSLSICDPITSTSKQLLDFSLSNHIIQYRSTLVSLKELGEGVKILESAEIEETKPPLIR